MFFFLFFSCAGGRLIPHSAPGHWWHCRPKAQCFKHQDKITRATHQLTAQFIFLPGRLIKRNSPPARLPFVACSDPGRCMLMLRDYLQGSKRKVREKKKQKRNLSLLSLQDSLIYVWVVLFFSFPLSALFFLSCFVFNSMHALVSRERSHCGWIMPSIWASVFESMHCFRVF